MGCSEGRRSICTHILKMGLSLQVCAASPYFFRSMVQALGINKNLWYLPDENVLYDSSELCLSYAFTYGNTVT